MSSAKWYSSGVREQAVRIAFDHEHEYDSPSAAIRSVPRQGIRLRF